MEGGAVQRLNFLWVRALPWGRLHKSSCAGPRLPACLPGLCTSCLFPSLCLPPGLPALGLSLQPPPSLGLARA